MPQLSDNATETRTEKAGHCAVCVKKLYTSLRGTHGAQAMSELIGPASPETRARLKALAEQPVPLDEWKRRLAIPLSPDEIEHTQALVRWFCRRYSTVGERFAYVRRAYMRWTGQAG